MTNLAAQLKMARIKQGYSQNEVASLLHLTRQAISKWETGRGYPDLDNLIYLSDIYELSIDELLKENEELKEKIKANKFEIAEKKKHLKRVKRSLYGNRDEGIFLITLALVSGIIPPVGIVLPLYVMWRNTKFNALYKTIYIVSICTILVSVVGTSVYISDNWLKPTETTVYKIN